MVFCFSPFPGMVVMSQAHTQTRAQAHTHPHSHTHDHAIARRQFLTAAVGMAAGLATGLRDQTAFGAAPKASKTAQGWDILIRGGRVVDPSQGLNGRYDVAIREGKIAQVAPTIDPAGWREVIDVDGRIVTPGFVDLHAHVYEGVSHYGINADKYCLSRGATTVLDPGSAGAQTFPGFRKYVIEVQATRIRALLNISVTGMLTALRGELEDLEHANVERAIRTIEQNRDLILGVKVRCGRGQSGPNDLVALQRALEAAEAVGLPLMMHITNTVTPIDQLLALLRRGDLLTHSFRRSGTPESADEGILTSEGILRTSAGEALERGRTVRRRPRSGQLLVRHDGDGDAPGCPPRTRSAVTCTPIMLVRKARCTTWPPRSRSSSIWGSRWRRPCERPRRRPPPP